MIVLYGGMSLSLLHQTIVSVRYTGAITNKLPFVYWSVYVTRSCTMYGNSTVNSLHARLFPPACDHKHLVLMSMTQTKSLM